MNDNPMSTATIKQVPVETASFARREDSLLKKSSVNSSLLVYLLHHWEALKRSFSYFIKTPLASVMTLTVIAITLALPTGLWVSLQNLQILSKGWEQSPQISLYLKMDVSPQVYEQLQEKLKKRTDIASVKVITPNEGLASFEQQSGFGNILAELPKNPLPAVIEIIPTMDSQRPAIIQNLLSDLKKIPEVDIAQLDMDWVKRLYNFILLGKRIISALALFLALAVLLIVGNTIRLAMQTYRAEVEVIKLVGGSNAYVRRPFLYSGIMLGLLGAIIAWQIINCVLLWVDTPVTQLAALYHSEFQLVGLNVAGITILLLTGILLGWSGSWIAIGRYLKMYR